MGVNKKSRAFKRLIKYLLFKKWTFLLAIILTFLTNILVLIGPYLSGKAIDATRLGMGRVDFVEVYKYFYLMLGFYVFSSILRYILLRIMAKLSQSIVYKMRKQVFEKIVDLPVKYFDNHQTGDLISRLTYDIDTINSAIAQDVVQIFTTIISVVFSLTMMISISPKLSSVFLVTIPLTIIFSTVKNKSIRPLFKIRSARLGMLNGYIEEIVSAQSVIKAYRQEETMIDRFSEKNIETTNAVFKAQFQSSLVGPVLNFGNGITLVLVSVFGAIIFMEGGISIGEISAFVLYSRKFSGPINELAGISAELQSTLSASERIFKVLDETPESSGEETGLLTDIKGKVEIENLSFGYDPEKPIIKDLNIRINEGELVAIVGETGAGKTTIINLLMRFYDPQRGRILIDGQDISQISRDNLRLAFAMVLQDTWLFSGSIYDNIAYGSEAASKAEVVKAARSARMHNYITKLPLGYNTIIEEGGTNISKGQMQLLTIARAMLLDAHILILDEATSNVDTSTEMEIQSAMQELMRGRTSFVIAHRLSTIKNADRILVFDDGRIIEQGNHDELLAKGGAYAQAFNSQFL